LRTLIGDYGFQQHSLRDAFVWLRDVVDIGVPSSGRDGAYHHNTQEHDEAQDAARVGKQTQPGNNVAGY
jgi:hypothetical protein